MPENSNDAGKSFDTRKQQPHALGLGALQFHVGEIGHCRFDRSHAHLGFLDGPVFGVCFCGRAVELTNPQMFRSEDAHRHEHEVNAGRVQPANDRPLFAQHVGVFTGLDGHVGQFLEGDGAVFLPPLIVADTQDEMLEFASRV